VLVTSRSYAEYVAMFDLDEASLAGARVLDCSAGAADFTAEARARHADAVAVDPAYALARDVLAETARASLDSGNAIAAQHADRFTWTWYGDRAARDRMRRQALARFVVDVTTNSSRYVAGALPALPFRDASFDLAVCSHLIFTWADQLGQAWHHAALLELVRVAREVRVFPTIVQGAGTPVPFWDALVRELTAGGCHADLRRVPYEFQVGGDHMLVLTRR
jgi:SAM-dependent methyltransferase